MRAVVVIVILLCSVVRATMPGIFADSYEEETFSPSDNYESSDNFPKNLFSEKSEEDGPVRSNSLKQQTNHMDKEMLNNIATMEDFFNAFNVTISSVDEEKEEEVISGESLDKIDARNAIEPEEQRSLEASGACLPELSLVKLDLPLKRDAIFYPTCVRVYRCGGCCVAEGTSCQSLDTKNLEIKVGEVVLLRSRASRGRDRRSGMTGMVHYLTVEEHLSCQCSCEKKMGHCDPLLHEYDPHSCNCVCINNEEKAKCTGGATKHWSEETCQCVCNHQTECSTGYEFDHSECKCVKSRLNIIPDIVSRNAIDTRARGPDHYDIGHRVSAELKRLRDKNKRLRLLAYSPDSYPF